MVTLHLGVTCVVEVEIALIDPVLFVRTKLPKGLWHVTVVLLTNLKTCCSLAV